MTPGRQRWNITAPHRVAEPSPGPFAEAVSPDINSGNCRLLTHLISVLHDLRFADDLDASSDNPDELIAAALLPYGQPVTGRIEYRATSGAHLLMILRPAPASRRDGSRGHHMSDDRARKAKTAWKIRRCGYREILRPGKAPVNIPSSTMTISLTGNDGRLVSGE